MRYRELAPPPDLAAVVRCFWILEDPAAAPGRADERILPDGCPEIVVHYGSPMAARRGEGPLERQAGAVVAGQIRGALRLAPGGPMGAVGARLQPWAAARLLRERLDRLTDRIVPLDDLWGRAAGELLEQVAESGGDDARVAYFGAALRRRLAARAPGADDSSRALASALAWIESSRGSLPVEALARRLQWSRRRLERRFLAEVGLPPKTMGRIARFRSVVAGALGGGAPSLAALAARCGYADQSHLAREFRELAGCTLTAWLDEQQALSAAFSGAAPAYGSSTNCTAFEMATPKG